MGIYSTVPSTTILDLARLLEVPQEDLGITYTARSLGSLLGGFILSAYNTFKRVKKKPDRHKYRHYRQILAIFYT